MNDVPEKWTDARRWVEALRAAASDLADDDIRAWVKELVQHALVRVPADVRTRREPQDWAALLADAAASLLARRTPGSPSLRVFRPKAVDGWESHGTVIQILTDDMPFLVDSVSLALAEAELDIDLIAHPILKVDRDEGRLRSLRPRDDTEASKESFIHLELEQTLSLQAAKEIRKRLLGVLADVRAAVEDWRPMLNRLAEAKDELAQAAGPFSNQERDEVLAFLDWLRDDNFTFLGYRSYRIGADSDLLRPEDPVGLGVLRDPDRKVRDRPLSLLGADEGGFPLTLTKTARRGTVHRPGHMDYVGIPRYDGKQAVGEHRFLGLYTSTAYTRRPWRIPVVRAKVARVIEDSGVARDSHAGKALLNILETLPRDELYQASALELKRLSLGILDLQERARTKLFVRRDPFKRFYACLVFIPRERFNTERRIRIARILKRALTGTRVDFRVQVDESPLARLYMIVRTKSDVPAAWDVDEVEHRIRTAVQSWDDRLRAALVDRLGAERGADLARTYAGTFPAAYTEDVTPRAATFDAESLDQLSGRDDMQLNLYRPRKRRAGEYRFKIFRRHKTLPLSEVLPVLENLGVRVISERPYHVEMKEGGLRWIQDFDLVVPAGDIDLKAIRTHFHTAFAQQLSGAGESDPLNRLIVAAALTWEQVMVLRAYCRFLLQGGTTFSLDYMAEALANHPPIVTKMIEAFEARFDPAREEGREAQVVQADEAVSQALESVRVLDEDRILRSFFAVIVATLRTNLYRVDRAPALSLKLASGEIEQLPAPRPHREIFVYSPDVEAVHLRGGEVARGGLRWSDRREDFRTEVLGLMKAQMVKNTVIVPVGAKGGFVVKRPPADREALASEVERCYRIFIHALLDVTDTLQGDAVVHPDRVVRRDQSDPYLVVAADKGTATFSDIANEISQSRDFWLGDAFASGGSVGYDHKKMGITARGAWESVKRHFREMGVDCQREDFTVVGIGDMGGDVFGNGMLLSRHIRLRAAFNHLHVFIDPEPDAAASYAERQRLFSLPRSSWADYDAELISPGGGVFERSSKSIPLSEPVREWLGIEVDALPPNALISALLRAPCDLLWNGGIGTYVKGKLESHAEVGDRANNALRVNGGELRCKVVGEGGNLGLTQRGRIEFARSGGRLNTDFIDNSAGVDCSDHEVNIKILLNDALTTGRLASQERADLLRDMTDEVAAHVLRNNYLQTQAISVLEAMSVSRLGSKAHYIDVLEQNGELDRTLEHLPSKEEFEELRLRKEGLTRPELATLLCYGKISLYRAVLASDLPEDPYLSRELEAYFPQVLRDRYADLMPQHRLQREIIASAVTNSVVNRMGSTFVLRMQEDTAAQPGQIVRAYAIAREVHDARALWAGIEALDGVIPWSAQLDALLAIWELLRESTRWLLLRNRVADGVQAEVARYAAPVRALRERLESHLSESRAEAYRHRVTERVESGFPRQLAERIALLPELWPAFDIVAVAADAGAEVADALPRFVAVTERLRIDRLQTDAEALVVEGEWHAQARAELRDRLTAAQHRAAVLATENGPDFVALARPEALQSYLDLVQSMEAHGALDYAMVGVATARLESLIAPQKAA